MRKRSVRKGKGERGAIAAEGGEVTAEEKRGSECERDRFTIYARRLLLGFCRPLPLSILPSLPTVQFWLLADSFNLLPGFFRVDTVFFSCSLSALSARPTRLPLLFKRVRVRPTLPESLHSLHIMKLPPLLLVLCIPLLALTASVLPLDMDTVLQRRLGFISASATLVSYIASWHVPTLCLSSYTSNALVP